MYLSVCGILILSFKRGVLPRAYAIHIYTLGGPLIAHCFSHLQDSSFCTRICCNVYVSDEGNNRRDIDDFAWSLELEELLADFLGSDERGFEVDGKDLQMGCQLFLRNILLAVSGMNMLLRQPSTGIKALIQ